MDTEQKLVEVESVVIINTAPDIQIGLETETGRSNWQHVASEGKLCRKPQWRWYGRFETGNVWPNGLRQWRKPS